MITLTFCCTSSSSSWNTKDETSSLEQKIRTQESTLRKINTSLIGQKNNVSIFLAKKNDKKKLLLIFCSLCVFREPEEYSKWWQAWCWGTLASVVPKHSKRHERRRLLPSPYPIFFLDFISTLFSKEKEKNGRLAHHATKAIEEALKKHCPRCGKA